MNLRHLDSPWQRALVAGGAAIVVLGLIAFVYVFATGSMPETKINGMAVVMAARNYTHDLIKRRKPIPPTVSLKELVDSGFLKSSDVAGFGGLEASVSLAATNPAPTYVLMRIHMPDGTDLVLMNDGTARQDVKR